MYVGPMRTVWGDKKLEANCPPSLASSFLSLRPCQLVNITCRDLGQAGAGAEFPLQTLRALLPSRQPFLCHIAWEDILRDGAEDVFPGDVAQEWLARWEESPKSLEREL